MSKAESEHEITELRLGLPGGTITRPTSCDQEEIKNEKKRVFSELGQGGGRGGGRNEKVAVASNKTAAVGWPPVCSYRRRSIGSEKECMEASKRLIKISMDGVPFLRKIDVSYYQEYYELVAAVEKLFGCYGISKLLPFLLCFIMGYYVIFCVKKFEKIKGFCSVMKFIFIQLQILLLDGLIRNKFVLFEL